MIDGFSWLFISVYFYLEYEKKRKNSSYQYYKVWLCSYIYFSLLLYISTLYGSLKIGNTFCHKTLITTWRQQQKNKHEIWGFKGK